jgi:hypothetical protein
MTGRQLSTITGHLMADLGTTISRLVSKMTAIRKDHRPTDLCKPIIDNGQVMTARRIPFRKRSVQLQPTPSAAVLISLLVSNIVTPNSLLNPVLWNRNYF